MVPWLLLSIILKDKMEYKDLYFAALYFTDIVTADCNFELFLNISVS